MNVFNDIYSSDVDPIERSFIIAETAFNIDIERANKEYMFETGLICLGEDTTFLETAKTNKENALVKFIKNICNGIRTFFASIGEAISSIFDKRKNISPEDLKNSSAKITISKDFNKFNNVIDDEIEKGNRLFNKVSKSNVSDNEIDDWIASGTKKIKGIASVAIPIASALGLNKIIKDAAKKKIDKLKHIEDASTSISNDTPEKQKQKKTIIDRTAELYQMYGKISKSVTMDIDSELNKLYKPDIDELDKSTATKSKKLQTLEKEYLRRFKAGKMTAEEYQKAIARANRSHKRIEETDKTQRSAISDKQQEDRGLLKLMTTVVADIEKKYSDKKIRKSQRDGYLAIIEDYKNKYFNKSITAEEFRKVLNGDYIKDTSDI
jgi:hypothetical protein